MAAYNTYEAVVNAVVGALYAYSKSRRSDSRYLAMYGIEKAIINLLSSYASLSIASVASDQLDTEYLIAAVIAGLYHSGQMHSAMGDQLMVSIISHLISNMTSSSGTDWFKKNVYGTTGAEK